MTEPQKIAVCIGCGCDDLHACVREDLSIEDIIERDPLGGGFLAVAARDVARMMRCHWLRLDRDRDRGVCSACPLLVEAWDAGDHDGVIFR